VLPSLAPYKGAAHMQVPRMTMAHSTALCQCSSLIPPGFNSVRAPAIVVEVKVEFVLAL
jgi:hypothetical protein